MALTHALSTNNYGPCRLIVATSAANGTHTTLTSAMADAVSGDTIFLRDSVTENVTLTPGVNISAWTGGSLNTPTITGTLTMTAAGTCNISGVRLATNSAALLAVTGSAASIVNLFDCYLNISNNTGITFSSSSASSGINFIRCNGNIGTTGIAIFSHSASGSLVFDYTVISNTGGSSQANTASAGALAFRFSTLTNPITTSGTSAFLFLDSNIDTSTQNVISITAGGSGAQNAFFSTVASGTASCITISTAMSVHGCFISSTNTNAISGAGTIIYSGIIFANTSTTINTTTQTTSGTLQGSKNTAPAGGFLGEQIRATIAGGGTAISLVSTAAKTITSINCTPGVWDISGVLSFSTGGVVSATQGSVNTTTNVLGTDGDNSVWGLNAVNGVAGGSAIIPAWRQTFTTTTTVYLVASSVFTVSSNAYGRISATRVG